MDIYKWKAAFESHRLAFGWTEEKAAERMARWPRILDRQGVTVEDFNRASERIQEMAKRPYAPDHLSLILQFAGKRQTREGWNCDYCRDNPGVVVVPWGFDPDTKRWNGKGTSAVPCKCYKGQQLADYYEKRHGKRPLDLTDYEAVVPDWRELLK